LGEYDESLTFALEAGKLFILDGCTEYVEMIVLRAIDKYIDLQNQKWSDPKVVIDRKLEDVVQRMFQKCFESKNYLQVRCY
jgi:26S proteasome regulatory subunit N2